MSNVDAGPQGDFVGPAENVTQTELEDGSKQGEPFVIQVTNVPHFGTGEGNAYVGLNGGYCYLTSDPNAAITFTGWIEKDRRIIEKDWKYLATPNGWLSYSG